MSWPIAFLLTLLIEVPVVLALTPVGQRRRLLPWVLFVNATSHPMLWFVLFPLFDAYLTALLFGEAAVWVFEALIYASLLGRRGLLIGIAANAASMLLGLILNGFLG